MANFLSSLFGSKKATQQPATALRINTSLQGVPIAILLGGQNRIGGNLIDYFNFNYQNASSSSGGKGGVFSGGSGKGNSGQYNYFVSFILALCEGPLANILNVWINGAEQGAPGTQGEDLILNGFVYVGETFLGTYSQTAWSYAEALEPARALPYRGIAYVGYGNYPLGSSTAVPNLTFEILSANSNAIPGQPDGDLSVALTSWLTDQHFGVGFPANRLGSLALWQSYTLALGLVGSPIVASPIVASALPTDMATATGSELCWQDGLLTVVPRGDQAVTLGQVSTITETHAVPIGSSVVINGVTYEYPSILVGNAGTFAGDGGVKFTGGAALTEVSVYAPTGLAGSGIPADGQYYQSGGRYYFNPHDIGSSVDITYDWAATKAYTPDTRSLYDFTIDDCLPNQGTIGSGVAVKNSPFVVVRNSRDQMLNNIKVRYLDRSNNYNPVLIEQKDEASIVAFGRERPSDVKQLDFWCLGSAAQQSAMLQLIQAQIPRKFQMTVGRHFLLIMQLMGIYTITDPAQGLERQAGRLIEVQENSDFSLTWTLEEYPGTVSAPAYGLEAAVGFQPNDNADPGAINPPVIFEPPAELCDVSPLGAVLQVWAAVSGVNTALWGGAFVHVSYDGQNYTKLPQPIIGAARMGVLSAALSAATINPAGQTVDTLDTLSVDLTESAGTLSAATELDATSLNTRSYVGPASGGGEIVAYANATLTGTSKYNLSYLVRGAFGTEDEATSHPIGSAFVRLDDSVFEIGYDASRIGATIYLKFTSFNIYQGGLQNLADVPAYTYVLTGSALYSPLPNVANLRTVYDQQTGFTELNWDEVTDFRLPKYEIRSGSSAAAAMTIGTVAHPPFRVPGDGTYWVAAVAQPKVGRTVYSEAWQSVTIAGAVITQNVILTVDLKALNWPGTFTGGAGIDSSLNAIRTGGGNILTDANVLTTSDILNYGAGTSLSGIYYPDDHAYLDIGYVTAASVAMKYLPTGVPVGQNILTIGDILTTDDILGSASTQFIDNYPLINTATTAGGDLYAEGDLYTWPDLYAIGDANWNGFQAFSAGTYQTRFLDFGFFLSTIDSGGISYNLAWTITITIPARIDPYAVTTSASADTTITFQPVGAASTAPFNGGPGPGDLPAVTWGIVNGAAGDDLIITALSLSAITFSVKNGGSRVVRNLNLFAEGF